MSNKPSFGDFFKAATGQSCYLFQDRFANTDPFPEVLDVPTGLGKTATVILAWLWRKTFHSSANPTPRRLIYCLPMRSLVTQTARVASLWVQKLSEAKYLTEFCRVHVLMGGEQQDDWDLHPERVAIIIGTQDMLLSRLLNRGYGMSRYRWPMHFGLLGNDCLWVMDEVQLMGSGLATTVQVDAFQKKLWKPLLPCQFLWMSATLGQSLLRTRDREDFGLATIEPQRSFSLEEPEKDEPAVQLRHAAAKTIEVRKDAPSLRKRDKSGVLDQHQSGRISLFILNTVPVAQEWYRQVRDSLKTETNEFGASQPDLVLLHSRYRPPDRQRQMESLQQFMYQQSNETGAVSDHPGLILVSTQVIEAGIDISSVRLWSEVAPWPSVIQRLGRLNREGKQEGAAATFWMPGSTEDNSKGAPNESKKKSERIGPYFKRDLETARKLLESVAQRLDPAGEHRPYRDALDAVIQTKESRQALEVAYEAVIRPHDFLDLFDTEPDLFGGFTDVSRFVRNQDGNMDAYVFWRETQLPERHEPAPAADELCPVPFYSLQQFLGTKGAAREWEAESGQWITRRAAEIRPGMTLRLWQKQGGYDQNLGWTGNPKDVPNVDQPVTIPIPDKLLADEASESHAWLSLSDHTADVKAETCEIVQAFGLSDKPEGKALSEAAHWHDVGKASIRWKKAIDQFLASLRPKVEECLRQEVDPQVQRLLDQFAAMLVMPSNGCWAKFPDIKWLLTQADLPAERRKSLRRSLYTPFQPRYRHEAASALVAWKAWQDGTAGQLSDLAIYLIATHHGKVRTVLRSTQQHDAVFGIVEGEELPPVDGTLPATTTIPVEPRRFGASGQWNDEDGTFTLRTTSWVSLVADLLGEIPMEHEPIAQDHPAVANALGPFKLAFLEMVFRAADARASARPGKGRNR